MSQTRLGKRSERFHDRRARMRIVREEPVRLAAQEPVQEGYGIGRHFRSVLTIGPPCGEIVGAFVYRRRFAKLLFVDRSDRRDAEIGIEKAFRPERKNLLVGEPPQTRLRANLARNVSVALLLILA